MRSFTLLVLSYLILFFLVTMGFIAAILVIAAEIDAFVRFILILIVVGAWFGCLGCISYRRYYWEK